MSFLDFLQPEQHSKLHWFQQDARDAALEALKEHDSALVVAATGLGKCLGVGTPILMFDGRMKRVEEIHAGDQLMGPDSRPRLVWGVSHGRGPLYRIKPTKGDPWICNDAHVMTLIDTQTGRVTDLPLSEHLARSKTWRHRNKLFSVGVDFSPDPFASFPIDPYVLGLWLGDGTKNLSQGFAISKPDEEVRLALAAFAVEWNMDLRGERNDGKCPTWRVVGPRVGRRGSELLRTMKALFPDAPERVLIPLEYLTGPREVRLALLAGLMDSDGHYAGGCFDFVQKSWSITSGVAYLARSLGIKVTVAEKPVGGVVYQRLVLSGALEQIPSRIPRKRAVARGQKKDALRTGFTATPIGVGDYYGFTLDGDGRFLLGDFTVTHNTQIFSGVAEVWQGNVLVLAHRDELVQQAADRLSAFTGENVEIEKRELRASSRARIVVGSVQSVTRQNRLDRLGADRFSLVIPDEAHHYVSATYRRVLDFFKSAKRLGVTATPDRGDEKALGKMFESVAYCMDISEGIEAGYLVPIRGRKVELGEIDISGVKVSGGDLIAGQLDEAMLRATEGIVKGILEHEPGRQGIGFFPGIKTASFATDRMNALLPGLAAIVTASTPLEERRQIMRDFKLGKIRYLFNVGVATEGFDAPTASLIIMGRPTKSRSLYAQMAGRGTRILPDVVAGFPGRDESSARRQAVAGSGKPDMVILDFVGNSGRHSLVGPEDLLGGNYSEAEVDLAKKKPSPGGDIAAALQRARLELRRIASEVKSQVRTKASSFDPFSCFGVDRDAQDARDVRFGYIPATDRQRDALRRAGVEDGDLGNLSKSAATKLMATMIKRRELGLAVYPQLKALRKFGVATPTRLSARNAARTIEYMTNLRGFPPDPDVIDGLIMGDRQMGDD